MRKKPNRMLNVPTLNWITRFSPGRRLAEKTKGKLMKMVITPMLSTEPRPKSNMYPSPARGLSIDARTNSVRAALPATPWTMPTK